MIYQPPVHLFLFLKIDFFLLYKVQSNFNAPYQPSKSFFGSHIQTKQKQIKDLTQQIYNQMIKFALIFGFIILLNAVDWTKVNDAFADAIADRVFPGGAILVANETTTIYRRNYGKFTYNYEFHDVEVSNDTKYDIASVTKVMATTLGIMNLVSSSSIKLDDLVSKYITNYDTNKKGNTTIANLLLHNSGLPYDYPGPLPQTPQDVLDFVTFAKPDFPVGSKFQYSNLNFYLLGIIIQKVSRKSFLTYFEQNKIFAGLKNTLFNPPKTEWFNVAPTQYDATIRKRIIRGQAHERLAYFLGGVAGHSGLFTTTDDLARFMRILLNKGKLPNEPTRIFSEAIVNQFTTRVTGLPYQNVMGYGFGTNCPTSKMTHCFGHDGSTGVMAWADFDKKILFVVMNNRGHPDVKNNLVEQFKAKIANQIFTALGY